MRKEIAGVRSAIGGTIARCTEPRCLVEFRSASDPSVIPVQLEAAGWEIVKSKHGRSVRCPSHSHRAIGMGSHGIARSR